MYNLEGLKTGQYGEFLLNEPLKNHTTFKVGGPCDILMRPKSEKEIIDIVRYCNEKQIPFMVIGNGSNLLVRDKGIRGVVIKLDKNFSEITFDGQRVIAQSGALLSTVSKKSFKQNLTGFEQVSGIPGSIGGAMVMNAGAYDREVSSLVDKVRCLTKQGQVVEYLKEEMDFSYRSSRVSKENLIVLSVEFKLEKGDHDEIMEKFADYDYRRRSKQPLDKNSAGSTFKRPEGYYASKLIDDAGLRGYTYKRAQVSEKHCGFVINIDDASCQDVLTLINQVQDKVFEKYGVELETEVKIIGEE